MTNGFQLVMPLDCEVNIEKNAPVRLLNAIMERMDYSKLYAAYMRNGQLKPGYNVNVATCSEFIIGSYISSDRSDMHKRSYRSRRLHWKQTYYVSPE